MGKKAILGIIESEQELQNLQRNQGALHLQKRIKALLRIKQNRDSTRQDLANYLGVHKRTLERWLSSYKSGGVQAMLTDSPRRQGSKIITNKIHKGLEQRANDNRNSFKGYWDAQRWIESEHGVKVKYQRVREYMIKHFGTKVKTPRKSHINKDVEAVAFFKNPE